MDPDVTPQELDINLARLLHQVGVAQDELKACLAIVSERRDAGRDAALAAVLLERRVIPAEVLIEALTKLAGRGGTLRAGSSGRVAASLPRAPQLEGYRILRSLAEGGMGAVYEAEDASGSRVAIKVIKSDPEFDPDGEDLARFRREAVLLASLDHPHIGRIRAADLERHTPFLVQELLSGGSLAERIQQGGPLPVAAVVDLGIKLAGALGHAHERGVLHRDVKPKNVVFDERGEPRLIDFGLARRLGRQSLSLTLTGTVLGTPAYMAPEQALGHKSADERTDVYGLGALLYTALTGERPFRGQLIEVLQAVIQDPPSSIRSARPEVPRGLEAVVQLAMAKDRDDRYSSCAALAEALAEYPRQERLRLATGVVVGAVIVLAVTTAIVLLLHGTAPREPGLALTSPALPAVPSATPTPAVTPPRSAGPPAWFTRRAAKTERPRRLPAGVRFGEQEGEYVNAADGSILVWVPAGSFRTGTKTPRRVTLSSGYFIGKYEVTWGQFLRFCDATQRRAPVRKIFFAPEHPVPDDHPVFNVTWQDCFDYCVWAKLRLPTEAEWEFAARGSDGRRFPWGPEPPGPLRLNLADQTLAPVSNGRLPWKEATWRDEHAFTAPVTAYPAGASPFGAFNMSGNIHEFVNDFYQSGSRSRDGVTDPQGPKRGDSHVIRGGCWKSNVKICDPSGRHTFFPNDTLGFRVARSAD